MLDFCVWSQAGEHHTNVEYQNGQGSEFPGSRTCSDAVIVEKP